MDISTFIKKYQIKPPQFIAHLPDDYIQTQKKFYQRAYLELLEHCCSKLDDRAKDDDGTPLTEFKTIFSADGQHLSSMAELQAFLIERRNEYADPSNVISLEEEASPSTMPAGLNVQFSLPQISRRGSHPTMQNNAEANSGRSPSLATLERKVSKVKRA